MSTENEPLWKKYRAEIEPLLRRLDYKEVWGWVDEHTNLDGVELPDHTTLDNARRFLQDETSCYYLRIPYMYFDGNKVVFDWTISDSNRIVVQFLPNNEWYVLHEKNICRGEGPESSFTIDEKDGSKTHYFGLPDDMMKEIEIPQPWSQEYQPRVRKQILWSTDYWDGPLAGYCSDGVGNSTYYFECVEEKTFNPGTRMYAVYELSPKEQVDAFMTHAKWIGVLNSPGRQWWHWFSWRLFRTWRLHNYQTRKDKWRAKHKLIGYFEG